MFAARESADISGTGRAASASGVRWGPSSAGAEVGGAGTVGRSRWASSKLPIEGTAKYRQDSSYVHSESLSVVEASSDTFEIDDLSKEDTE